MKTRIKQLNVVIVGFAIMCILCGCGTKKIEQREVAVDVIISSALETSILPEELQSLYAPLTSLPDKDNTITMFIPTGKLNRTDLKTPVTITVKYQENLFAKIQGQIKKPKEDDIRKFIEKYLSTVVVESLNSKDQIDKNEKINRVKEFIRQQQGEDSQNAEIMFFSESPKSPSWDKYKVYNSIDSIRELILESVSSNPKNKFLIVYNPPLNSGDNTIISNDSVIISNSISTTSITLVPTALSLKKGESKPLKETVYPKDATNKEVSWESSDETIITVNSTGMVTAVAEKGTATITVKTQDGGKTAQCKVTIGIPPPPYCTIPVPCGTYKGECKYGQPDGMGTVRYNCRTLICPSDPKKRYAEAGQYIVGQFRNGSLLQGKLFDSSGNQIETIICGGGAY